jgi:hypothetical protein
MPNAATVPQRRLQIPPHTENWAAPTGWPPDFVQVVRAPIFCVARTFDLKVLLLRDIAVACD